MNNPPTITSHPHKRDRQFRKRVLLAYEYRCAVCGLDVRLGSVSLALDATHVRWHQAGGPNEENNGLALCVLHHKLFDLGAFTLDGGGTVLVSEQVHGTTGFEEVLCVIMAAACVRRCGRSGGRPPPTSPGMAARSSRDRRDPVLTSEGNP